MYSATKMKAISRAVLSCGTAYYMHAVQGGSKSVDETLLCDHSNESY